jgi:hypothetical protein
LAALLSAAVVLPSCTLPARPAPHGQEPLGGLWYYKAGDDPAWAQPGLDETDFASGWRLVDVPGGLKAYGSKGVRAGWLRVRFPAPPEAAAVEHVLALGRADAVLEAWLNGAPLKPLPDAGAAGSPLRAFAVPPGALREENLLAVRSADWQEAGGILAGTIELAPRVAWEKRAPAPAAVREIRGAFASAAYDPNTHRLTAFTAGGKTVLDDVHFVLRTKVREYDLSRIPEEVVETLPDGRGVRTLHVLAGEKIRFETRYVLPAPVEWPALVVVGEAKAEDGREVDLDLVYHAAAPGVIGTGALRTTTDGRFTWGRLFVYAPKGDLEILPESARKYYKPEGAFELLADSRAGLTALPYPFELPLLQGAAYQKLQLKTLTLDFGEAGLSEILNSISTACDLNVRLPSDTRDKAQPKKVSFKTRDLSTHGVLLLLLSQWGLGYEIDDQGCINITERGQGFLPDPKIFAFDKLEQARHVGLQDDRESEELEKKMLSSFDQIRVTLEFTDQPLREVVEFLRQFTNLSFVFDGEVDQAKTVTYRCQNTPLSQALKDILGSECEVVSNPRMWICSSDTAKSIREKKLNEKTRRDQVLSHAVPARSANLTATLDRLRRIENLPIVPDRDVWEKGKTIAIDADAVPLRDFLDRAAAKLGAKWVYSEGSIYLYIPAAK